MSNLILLADDSPDDALYFKRVLARVGVTNPVEVVADGRETIAYLKGEGKYADRSRFPTPQVLFLDLLMPGADGWFVLNWMASQPQSNMLVFVITGVDQNLRLHEAYALGAHSFIYKPFEVEELRTLIHYWPGPWILKSPNTTIHSPLPKTSERRPHSPKAGKKIPEE